MLKYQCWDDNELIMAGVFDKLIKKLSAVDSF